MKDLTSYRVGGKETGTGHNNKEKTRLTVLEVDTQIAKHTCHGHGHGGAGQHLRPRGKVAQSKAK